MTFWIEPLTDAAGTKYWILFEHGQFHNPTAVIEDAEMKSIAAAVLGTCATIDDLAHDLKMYRKAKRYSQKEMAALIGISRNYLSQIERGEAKNLSLEVVDRIRRELG